jgi:hypothetical protein
LLFRPKSVDRFIPYCNLEYLVEVYESTSTQRWLIDRFLFSPTAWFEVSSFQSCTVEFRSCDLSGRYHGEFRAGARSLPELERDWNGIDIKLLPPCGLITGAMELAVMEATNWNNKLVAYCASKCTRLHKPKMMGV